MDLRGWVVTCVDGMRLVGREQHKAYMLNDPLDPSKSKTWTEDKLEPAYEMRVDVIALPAPVDMPGKGRVLLPMPQVVRQLMPIHATPSITSYPLPEDARLIDLTTLSAEDQRDYARMIEEVRAGIEKQETQQRSGLVVPT